MSGAEDESLAIADHLNGKSISYKYSTCVLHAIILYREVFFE